MKQYKIYVCYSQNDIEIAEKVIKAFREKNITCYETNQFENTSEQWGVQAEQQIKESDYFVLIFSRNAVNSFHVPREVGIASSEGKKMVVINIDATKPKGALKYHLINSRTLKYKSLHFTELASFILEENNDNYELSESKISVFCATIVLFLKKNYLKVIILFAIMVSTFMASSFAIHLVDSYSQRWNINHLVVVRFFYNTEMTQSEIVGNANILEERLDIFFGEKSYRINQENDYITVSLPIEEIGKYHLEYLLDILFARPMELYMIPLRRSTEEFIWIERNQIVSIYTEDDSIFINVTEEMAKKLQEAYVKWGDDCKIAQDIETSKEWVYFEEFTLKNNGKTICVRCEGQDLNLCESIAEAYRNPCLTEPYTYEATIPVYWDNVQEADLVGEYQCNVSEMNGELIDAVYDNSDMGVAQEISQGQWYDFNKKLREYLDLLKIPYAVGHKNENEQSVVVRINADAVCDEILETVCLTKMDVRIIGENGQSLYCAELQCKREEGERLVVYVLPSALPTEYRKVELAEKIPYKLYVRDMNMGRETAILEGYAQGEKIRFYEAQEFSDDTLTSDRLPSYFLLLEESIRQNDDFEKYRYISEESQKVQMMQQ